MTDIYWPGTTIPISRGNGFDLAARMARGPSIFCNLTSKQAKAGSLGGALSSSTVATVAGLSKRAQAELNKAPKAITLGKLSDTDKRLKARKAAI
ncbi:hypothetical protein [Hydrogenophaga sp.]|uniref:hypothetical protein n=1 Tax=Hydrogenophaga sp. TaxID=1904254 RepID=UPI003D0C206E